MSYGHLSLGERHYAVAATKKGLEAHIDTAEVDGVNIRTRYDSRLRPLETVAADGTKTKWTYGSDGATEQTTTASDGWNISVIDSADGKQRTVRPEGEPEIRAHYDEGGRLVELAEENLTLLSQQWRTDGQLASVTTGNLTAQLRYGDNSILESLLVHPKTTDTKLAEWQETSVDILSRPIEVKDSTGLDLQIRYDSNSNITTLLQKTHDGNQGFNIHRDKGGRLETIESSWGKTNFDYADNGDLEKVRSQRNGVEASIDLAGGRIRKFVGYDGGTTEYDYYKESNLSGLLKSVSLPNSLKVVHRYNNEGRIEEITVGSIRHVKLEYDAKNRIRNYVWQSY
jgi:hypothetical protein